MTDPGGAARRRGVDDRVRVDPARERALDLLVDEAGGRARSRDGATPIHPKRAHRDRQRHPRAVLEAAGALDDADAVPGRHQPLERARPRVPVPDDAAGGRHRVIDRRNVPSHAPRDAPTGLLQRGRLTAIMRRMLVSEFDFDAARRADRPGSRRRARVLAPARLDRASGQDRPPARRRSAVWLGAATCSW